MSGAVAGDQNLDEVSAGFGDDPISRRLGEVGDRRIAAMDDQA